MSDLDLLIAGIAVAWFLVAGLGYWAFMSFRKRDRAAQARHREQQEP